MTDRPKGYTPKRCPKCDEPLVYKDVSGTVRYCRNGCEHVSARPPASYWAGYVATPKNKTLDDM